MLESLMLAQLGVVLKEVVGPLAKAAAEDWCKDRLKQGADKALALNAPDAFKKAVKQSLKNFIKLFGDELENCGLPSELVKHDEFAKPLGRLLATESVNRELCRAFETGREQIDWRLLPDTWNRLSVPSTFPEEFEWEDVAGKYVRRVKGLIRQDAELARQLELDQQRAIKESNEALVGVPVQFDLRQYQEALKEKFGSLSLDSLDTTGAAYDGLRLWKIFVAQDVRECAEFAPQLYELPKERLLELQAVGEIDPLLSLDVLEQRRRSYAERPVESVRGVVGLDGADTVLRSVILGDPGSGKSTLLRALALSWADRSLAELRDEPIPLLIELRLYAQDKEKGICNDFLEYLHRGNTACRLNQLELDELLKAGKAVALFDGVDEVFYPALREAVVTDIHRFSNRYPAVQMVVTSRWLGYKAEALRNAEFAHYMLQDLNDEQIEDFLERWHGLTFTAGQKEERERKQGRLQKAIEESKAIRELAGNPLLLTMMAILNRSQELPRDRARLYERASEVLLYQWDVEEKLYEQEDLKNWQIDVRDKQAMLRKVAHHMQANEKGLSGNVISRDDLEEILTDYLKTRDVDRARPVARVMIEQLRERNFILCYLGADNYAFVHRTFLEYFCASEFVYQFEKERALGIDELKELFKEHFQDESWDEVLKLIANQIDKRFADSLVRHLADYPMHHSSFLSFFDGIISNAFLEIDGVRNLLLAADCLAEVQEGRKLNKSSGYLLELMKKKVEPNYFYELSSEAASALVERIAHYWESPETLTWLKQTVFCCEPEVYKASIRMVAKFWMKDPETLSWLHTLALQDDFTQACVSAIQVLSDQWKDHPATLEILKHWSRGDILSNHFCIYDSAISELSRGWDDSLEIIEIIKNQSENGKGETRVHALRCLSKSQKDNSKILKWLYQRLEEDDYWHVKEAAIQEIVRRSKENPSDAKDWLVTLLHKDKNESVRRAALRELSREWKDELAVFEVVKSRACEDENAIVRSAAIEELATTWKKVSGVLNFIKQRTQDDSHIRVRRTATVELAKAWPNTKGILTLLIRSALSQDEYILDSAEIQTLMEKFGNTSTVRLYVKNLVTREENTNISVRRTALRMLARNFSENSEIFSILKALAQSHSHYSIRSSALQEMIRNYKGSVDMFDFWRDRATLDPFERESDFQDNPRKIALEVLIQQHSEHTGIMEILHDRRENDTDDQLRDWATEQLNRLAEKNEH